MTVDASRLGVVIVSHNNEADLTRCLDSLVSPGMCKEAQIIVRDCGSTDDSVLVAKGHPAVTNVINGGNIGFGPACNDAVSQLIEPVDYVLILNPDAGLEFAMTDLLHYIGSLKHVGCIGVRQQSFDNKLVWSWDEFPSPILEWKKAKGSSVIQRSPSGYKQDRRVDWVMGAFLLIPYRAFIDIGGFDDRFFMFCEETDLCKRLQKNGLSTYFINGFHYIHDRREKATVWREVLRLNSRREYDRKWLSTAERVSCQLAHTYRWLRSAVKPTNPLDRSLALPRLLATWDLLHAATPPAAVAPQDRGWGQVRIGLRRRK
ncbi:glycosyltransferase [Nocardia sp. CA-135398]|uniref:glycosyltransferase n=1 Tax=Nocardia sp. CA-135398 TaxID=3239977 RepID=UPI003D963145